MITGEIKNKVDDIWMTFHTSGLTNPMDVLSQMTYLFFMKMLDDAQSSEEANAKFWNLELKSPTFPDGEWEHPDSTPDHPIRIPYNSLRWKVFKETGSDNMFKMVRENVFTFIKNIGQGTGSAYSRYMEDAVFLIQKPKTLQKLVNQISDLDMNNRDTMGDVYEYILGKMAASGTNGQFRTPRHIIRMMVELMQPSLANEDIICDPAMGSAGFIVEAAKYIMENEKALLVNGDKLKHFKNVMFSGYDTDPTMLRLGAMNMQLHNVDSPNIEGRDSLSDDNPDTDRFSLILANPPFTGSLDKEGVSKSVTRVANTGKTELLFLSLFLRMLQAGGRCACIVPDGVLFGSSKAHVAIRQEIVEKHHLKAVISMPSGVFKPYAGVSTAILIFTKTGIGGTNNVWFYDMKADGFSLDDKRAEVKENDIPDIISRFHNLDKEVSRSRKDQSFFVPVDEIRGNDYDLSINKYKEIEREVVEYEPLSDILERITSRENNFINLYDELQNMLKEAK